MRSSVLHVGLISDTHGLLRPEAVGALRGSDYIVHAGDIGGPAILSALAEIAPVTAVRGNNDTGAWAKMVPEAATLRVGAVGIHVVHDSGAPGLDSGSGRFQVLVSGHSHRPLAVSRGGVWFVNPGSAGPQRFKLPVSVGSLRISGSAVEPRLIELLCPAPRSL